VATEERIKSKLYAFLSETKVWVRKPSMEILSEEGSDAWTWETTSYNPKRKNVGEVLDALKAIAYQANALPPKWLEECDGSVYPEAELIAFDNGVLHVPTDTFLKHSPLFFNINSVPFDYNAEAGDPVEWNKFLDDLWADDLESRDTLQEIMGLLLLPETKHQKIFGIVGPKRAGKGVIARVVRGLLGAENVAAPILASLSTNFGLSSLIGKRAAIISDARLSGRADQHTIAERLLSISGEDAINIDRKYLQVWTGTLSVRFLILTNEVPRIADTSGALPSRLIFLEMKESFYGREDLGLTTKLLNELPNIALWAIQGWKRLQERGYFLQPSAALDIIRVMEDLSSPVGAFVRDCCDMGVGKEIVKKQMFKAYQLWSKDGGKTITASDATFGRDLLAATHRKVTSRQPIPTSTSLCELWKIVCARSISSIVPAHIGRSETITAYELTSCPGPPAPSSPTYPDQKVSGGTESPDAGRTSRGSRWRNNRSGTRP
jgi:putative DNA primase/helicase